MSLRRRRHYEDHAIVEIEEALPSRRKERSPWTMIPRRLWIHWTIASRQKSYYLTLLFLSLLLFLVPTSQSVEVEVDLEGNSPPRSSSVSRKVHSLTFAFSLGLNAVRTKLSDFYTRAGPDFGGIEVFSLQYAPRHFYRMIEGESEAWYNQDKALQLHHMDEDWHSYNERWEELDWEDPSLRKECHPLPFSSSQHQNCNTLHELSLGREVENPLQQFRRRYLAHGAFRDTWLLESIHDQVVLKAFRLAASDVDFSWHSGKYIFKEALIMEKTSASNRTNNMYGHCYSSVLVEFGHEISQRIVQGEEYRGRGRITQKELDELQVDDVHPFNDFDAEEKLEIALSMAEGIAILHGHEEGVIMNDDVHPDQWLVDANGNVKLNDFNNARLLDWNPTTQSYCKFEQEIGGDYRSPEEMDVGKAVDEKSDVWPIGANMFALLTGLFPYYEVWETESIQYLVYHGQKPYIDPRYKTRSYIEGRLVEIMELCWEYIPENRISIFEVVAHLRETKRVVEERKKSGDIDWVVDPAGLISNGTNHPIKKFRSFIPRYTPEESDYGRYELPYLEAVKRSQNEEQDGDGEHFDDDGNNSGGQKDGQRQADEKEAIDGLLQVLSISERNIPGPEPNDDDTAARESNENNDGDDAVEDSHDNVYDDDGPTNDDGMEEKEVDDAFQDEDAQAKLLAADANASDQLDLLSRQAEASSEPEQFSV